MTALGGINKVAAIPWITAGERVVGKDSALFPADVANRPLRALLSQSGYDPDGVSIDLRVLASVAPGALGAVTILAAGVGAPIAGQTASFNAEVFQVGTVPGLQVGTTLIANNDAAGFPKAFYEAIVGGGTSIGAHVPPNVNDILFALSIDVWSSTGAQIFSPAMIRFTLSAACTPTNTPCQIEFWTMDSAGGTSQRWDIIKDGRLIPYLDNTYDIGASGGNTIRSFYFTNGLFQGSAGTKVVGARKTGWAVWTGTKSRATKDSGTATLADVAQTLAALIDDLHNTAGHGLIGT